MNRQRFIPQAHSRIAAFAALATATSVYAYTQLQSPIRNDAPADSSDVPAVAPKKTPKFALPKNVYPPDYPGVYAWGSNAGGVVAPGFEALVSNVKAPYRIPYFDGKLLRDLKLTETLGVAVLDNGDVVQWGSDYFGSGTASKEIVKPSSVQGVDPEISFKGKSIRKIAVSDSKAVYGLNSSGTTVYAWPVSKSELQNGPKPRVERSWWRPWRLIWRGSDNVSYITLKTPPLGFSEYIDDVQVGNDHVLVLTSKGRVFSGVSGVYPHHTPSSSKGQLGIAKFSQFDQPPPPGTLYEIKHFKNRLVSQIACGDYHSLARTLAGDVYVFGENSLGQLGLPYSYKNAFIAVPTLLPLHKLYPRKINPVAVNIAAGGSTSFVSIKPEINAREFYREFPGEDDESMKNFVDQDVVDQIARNVFAFGNGLKGQLGNGTFIHAQSSPIAVKYFSQMKEYSEDLGKMVPIDVSNWSVGKNHVAVAVGGTTVKPKDKKTAGANKDVVIWGGNDFWQLGTGKRNSYSNPNRIPALDTLSLVLSKKKDDTSEPEEDVSKVEYIENVDSYNNRMQLLFHKPISYKDQNGRTVNATVSQNIVAGTNNTGLFTKRA